MAAPQEHLSRLVWKFAWPAVALNSLQVVNMLLDRFFVGQLDSSSLTAQSASMSLMFLLFSGAMALSTGATAIVSRAFGAKQESECREGAQQSANLALWSGIALAIIGFLVTPLLTAIFISKQDPRAAEHMNTFLAVYALGLPAIFIIQVLAGSLRAVGDTKSPMWISGIQILLHISLNFIFIFPERVVGGIHLPGMKWGLAGAAAALTLSNTIASVIYLAYAKRSYLGTKFSFSLVPKAWVTRILHIAIPSAAMSALRVFSMMSLALVLKVTPHGGAAMSAMNVAFSVESIMFMPAFGLSIACAALVGQSLGMKDPHRAERVTWISSTMAAVLVLLVVLPIYFNARNITSTMVNTDPKVIRANSADKLTDAELSREITDKQFTIQEATVLLQWLCLTEIFFTYAMVFLGALQGAGDTQRSLWVTASSLWLVRVPLCALLALTFGYAARGVWFGISLTQVVQGVLSMIVFRQGKWKTVKV